MNQHKSELTELQLLETQIKFTYPHLIEEIEEN